MPLLFTLVADVLSKMLKKGEECAMGRELVRLSHVQFVDDAILFLL